MNKFLRSLASFCDKQKLDPKVLIGPSLRVVRQWVETLTRNRISVINLRVQTFKGFVFTLASPILNVNGQRSISETGNRVMDHAFSSAKVTVEVVRHAVTVRLNSC